MARRTVVIVNDTSVDRHHGCARVMRTLRTLVARRGMEVIAEAVAHRDWRDDADFARAFARASLVLVNGEGTIHHDRPAGRALLEAGRAARTLGIPAALINASWQANDVSCGALLKEFTIVAVRESESLREVAGAGVVARRVPDLSLYFDGPASGPRREVGFTDSVLPQTAERLRALRLRHDGRALSILEPARAPWGRLSALRYAASATTDRSPLGRLRSVGRALGELGALSPTEEAFVARMSGLRLLVTGRFHGVCLALVTRTPFVAVETNTHKIHGLIADTGVGAWRVTSASAVDGELLARAAAWEPGELEALGDFLADGRRATDALFDDLSALAG